MSHPNSVALEAFACGELSERVDTHLRACADCRAFVERARGALSAGPTRARAAEAVARAAARAGRAEAERGPGPARAAARRRWLVTASAISAPLAAAALLVLLVRTPSGRDVVAPPVPEPPTALPRATVAGDITFKGGVQVAVIRERGGEQERYTGPVDVRPGDQLRIEVAIDRPQEIAAAIRGDDGTWLELMSPAARPPGTHFSERSARVDASPLHGTILVGSPDALARAHASGHLDDLTKVRVRWSAP